MNRTAQVTSAAETLRFHLAGAAYEVTGVPAEWLAAIPDRLISYQAGRSRPALKCSTLVLELARDAEHLRPPVHGHDLHETSRMDFAARDIEYCSDWCQGNLAVADGIRMKLQCHIEAGPWFGGLLENALRVMVAYDVLGRGGLLMHSAALVIDDKAHVLFGHSGAGKSTASAIAMHSGYPVLSDDINVLLPSTNGWEVVRVPFCGSVGGSIPGANPIPLAGLFSLQKSLTDKLEPLSGARATSSICASAPFVNQDRFRADALLDNAQHLAGDIPVHRLYFQRERTFLDLIAGSARIA